MPVYPVDPLHVKVWLDRGDAVLVDVRESVEYAAQSICGAVSLPLRRVCDASLPDAGSKKLVLYCQSGVRSSKATDALMRENPDRVVYHMEGGIVAWRQAGLPVSNTRNILPLDRQVHLFIGFAGALGSMLALWLDPLYALIPLLLGIGLMFAGLTGFCGLALVLARMPWNRAAVTPSSACCNL